MYAKNVETWNVLVRELKKCDMVVICNSQADRRHLVKYSGRKNPCQKPTEETYSKTILGTSR